MKIKDTVKRTAAAIHDFFVRPLVRDSMAISLYLAVGLISLLFAILDIALGYTAALNSVVAVCTVILSVFFCYTFRKNIGLFLVSLFIAYTNYSIAVGVYLVPSLRITLYSQFENLATYGIAVCCTLFFEFVLFFFAYPIYRDTGTVDLKDPRTVDNYEYNIWIAIGALVVYAALFFSSFRFGEDGGRGTSSALNEYRTVVMILGCYFSGRKKPFKYLWTVLVGITSLLILMSGNRIDMFGSAICLIIFWYADFITYRKILLLFPVAVVGLAAVGFFRAESFSASMLLHTVRELWDSKLIYEGAIYAYLPSLSVVELTYLIPAEEKLTMLWEHIRYIFTVGAAGASRADLSDWSRAYYAHYWGYLSPTYFFFWFQYLGPVLFGLLVHLYGWLYRFCLHIRTERYVHKWFYIMGLYFICNVARWYEYGPMGLLRGMFVCSVVSWIVFLGDFLIRRIAPRIFSKKQP